MVETRIQPLLGIELAIFFKITPLLAVLWSCTLQAQQAQWVTGEAQVAAVNISIVEARRKAVELARLDALEKMQIQVEAQSHLIRSDSPREKLDAFVEFIHSSIQARIVEEDTIGWEQFFTREGFPVYRVRIRIKAVPEKEMPDPGFLLNLRLNQRVFRSGEEMIVEVQPTRDCYLYLFNLVSGDSLFMIFPNELLKDNYIQSGEHFIFPPASMQRFLALEVKNDSPEIHTELLLAIGTRRKIPFSDVKKDSLTSLAYIPRLQSALFALNKWLLKFKTNERVEESVMYQVLGTNELNADH